MSYLDSVAAYGDQMLGEMDSGDLEFLRAFPGAQLPRYHSTWGMSIRNACGLWDPSHPLTAHWHKHPGERDVRGGVDHSEDHPDAVSMAIMRHVHRGANAT